MEILVRMFGFKLKDVEVIWFGVGYVVIEAWSVEY